MTDPVLPTTSWSDDVEQSLEEDSLAAGTTVPPIPELLEQADEIAKTIAEKTKKDGNQDRSEKDDLDTLMEGVKKPSSKSSVFPTIPRITPAVNRGRPGSSGSTRPGVLSRAESLPESKSKPTDSRVGRKPPLKKKVETTETTGHGTAEKTDENKKSDSRKLKDELHQIEREEAEDISPPKSFQDYDESFTSQQETAEIREHIEALDNKMNNIEMMLDGLLKERKNLPMHLDRHREEMNQQLTIIMDRLHTALEKDISSSQIQQGRKDLEVLSSDTNKVINQIREDLQDNPNPSSPTAGASSLSTGRRRIRRVE